MLPNGQFRVCVLPVFGLATDKVSTCADRLSMIGEGEVGV
jgi:hypothetical protein